VISEPAVGRVPLRKRKRRPEDALPHSVNHWIRVEILAILSEGEFSTGEIAKTIGEDVKNVRPHVVDLYKSGCIEFAGYKMVGGGMRPVYRALVLPVVYDETYRKMSLEERHDLNSAVVQGIFAETMSSFRTGNMNEDEQLCLVWDALSLDPEGKKELLELLAATWEGAQAIHGRAANRLAKLGKIGETTFVGLQSFRRGRSGRPEGGYHGVKKK
jgi:hypothetical protein